MEYDDAKRIVGNSEFIDWVCGKLQVSHFKLRIELCHVEGAAAEVDCSDDYVHAFIKIDPHSIDDNLDLMRVLRHEFIHLLTSPHVLSRETAEKGFENYHSEKMFERVWHHQEERCVVNIECMLTHGMNFSPDAMLKKWNEINSEAKTNGKTVLPAAGRHGTDDRTG